MTSSPENARKVTSNAHGNALVDVSSLVLLAVLLAAGFVLNLTVGNALALTGIKPQFIIAAYALAIILTGAGVAQAAVFGLVAAAVTQLTTSIPGLNFVTDTFCAVAISLLVRVRIEVAGRSLSPFVATLVSALACGILFACLGTLLTGAALPTALAKGPVVVGSAVIDAVLVQLLAEPLRKVRGARV